MLSSWCDDLTGLPEEVWMAYAHAREPLRGKVPRSEYADFYRRAVRCGEEQADSLRRELGGVSCREIAGRLGVTVEELPMPESRGLATFACFYEPDRIELYTDNAQATRSLLQAAGLAQRMGDTDIGDMLLAHELFHVVQQRKPELYVNQNHVLLWKLGKLRRESRLVSLEEVAAMAFARRLLGMAVSPYLYDVWMLLPTAPEQAQELYRRLMRLSEEVKADADDALR